jgi:hypothetical protein
MIAPLSSFALDIQGQDPRFVSWRPSKRSGSSRGDEGMNRTVLAVIFALLAAVMAIVGIVLNTRANDAMQRTEAAVAGRA